MEHTAKFVAVLSIVIFTAGCAFSIWRTFKYGYEALLVALGVAIASFVFGGYIPTANWNLVDAFGVALLLGIVIYYISVHAILGTRISEFISNALFRERLLADGKFHGIFKQVYYSAYLLLALMVLYGLLRLTRGDFFAPSI